ncbi:hypothetical protein A0H81_06505 [Grifola frondosa]|uniref:Secreted protein n=1 Tax=Grifola frondosa TaxID=5627 RepID=A0A1C7MAK0_GRIFR|nr:hypothetical protein A0H81_06505 [Grifola frondosa]
MCRSTTKCLLLLCLDRVSTFIIGFDTLDCELHQNSRCSISECFRPMIVIVTGTVFKRANESTPHCIWLSVTVSLSRNAHGSQECPRKSEADSDALSFDRGDGQFPKSMLVLPRFSAFGQNRACDRCIHMTLMYMRLER